MIMSVSKSNILQLCDELLSLSTHTHTQRKRERQRQRDRERQRDRDRTNERTKKFLLTRVKE